VLILLKTLGLFGHRLRNGSRVEAIRAFNGADWGEFGSAPELEAASGVNSSRFRIERHGTKISAAGENETACDADHGE